MQVIACIIFFDNSHSTFVSSTTNEVREQWKYVCRAIDHLGHTMNFLLAAKCDHTSARSFFQRVIGLHDVP
ncbi:DDE-type integrase/transposase/recombinase [Undibacterium sp. SXout20W]|uniref:DDE-type integrase/transposase/recombinase n=1 Tax=Undibacterium sp. SXout20W TaxID=3413051 RepID=UPI003BF1A817